MRPGLAADVDLVIVARPGLAEALTRSGWTGSRPRCASSRAAPAGAPLRRVALWPLLAPIYLWRFVVHALVPGGPATCRFEPSCSRYAEQAIRMHGPLRGSLMALRRLSHCHPFSRHDPVDPVTPR